MGLQCILFPVRVCRGYYSALTSPIRLTCVRYLRTVPTYDRAVRVDNKETSFFNCLYSLRSDSPRRVLSQQAVTSAAVVKDVLLFEHDRSRFFRLLAVFCAGQFLFWTYLAYFAFTGLRDTRKGKSEPRKVRTDVGLFSFDMNLGSNAWRFGFTSGCLVIGGGIVALGLLFSRRSVSSVILHRGGRKVTVRTQSPLGADKAWQLTVPLNQVACHAHRLESPSFIPLKIKDQKFYFLLDKEGTLNNPKLFDVTVGAYRAL